MKRLVRCLSAVLGMLCIMALFPLYGYAAELDLDAVSAILMEAETGRVLYEKNPDERLPPASVTKIMTLLLVMEAVETGRVSLTDQVSVSSNAASMGGSQVYLEPGEQMQLEELVKCVVVASANDAAVALAEHVAGSEEEFVARMNAKATELGMENTHFQNTNGLDDTTTDHYSSARDIALMSAALLRYPKILEYSGIWMDSIRNGAFTLTNTNRLIRFYQGATGLKTGSTAKAKFCISATAERNGMHLIAVIMASSSRDARNESAKKLLDYGFANYSCVRFAEEDMESASVTGGLAQTCKLRREAFSAVLSKEEARKVTETVVLEETLCAPISEGQQVGTIEYTVDGESIGSSAIVACETVDRVGFGTVLAHMLRTFFIL